MNPIRRTINPMVKVLDAKAGIVEYVASDETVDSYKEVIKASGWRFTNFQKNAPFVDSHDYTSIEKLLGKVVSFEVVGKQLVETVQWAKDSGNKLADIGWKMTEAGFLRAVSVGFWPVKVVHAGDAEHTKQLSELGIPADAGTRSIYLEQEQIELSAVIIGANPNALAKSYKAGCLTDADLDTLSLEAARRETASEAESPAYASLAHRLAQNAFLEKLTRAIRAQ